MKKPPELNHGSTFPQLNATQFMGALNDNVFQQLIIFALIAWQGLHSQEEIIAFTGIVFALPFILFMPLSGVLADRISKQRIIVWAKISEVIIMLLGAFLFYMEWGNGLYVVLFLMCTQSAFFGPSKFGIIPELVPESALSKANGYLQGLTYLAIILGSVFAPFISERMGGDFSWIGLWCVLFAALGLISALGIRKVPAADTSATPIPYKSAYQTLWHTLKTLPQDRYLFTAVLATAYFMLIAAFMKLNLIPYGTQAYGLSPEESFYWFLPVAFGIGAGSLLAGKLSGRHIEFGLVPLGAAGLCICSCLLAMVPESYIMLGMVLFFLGISAGLFQVPLEAFIQFRSPPEQRGKIIATAGLLKWIGVLLAAFFLKGISWMDNWGAVEGFWCIAVLTAILVIRACWILPDFLFRFVVMCITRTFYKLKVHGEEHVPQRGPALIVPNHVSMMDAILLAASTPRRIRFLMSRRVMDSRLSYKLLARLAHVIPIHAEDGPKAIKESLQKAGSALDEGYLVAIFAEGNLSRTGMMMKFRKGMEHIMQGRTCPIIPVYIGGMWGSIFSYAYGSPMTRRPFKIPFPVSLYLGAPMPSNTSAFNVRQRIQELSVQYYESRKHPKRNLYSLFIKQARSRASLLAVSDTTGKKLTFIQALIGSRVLALKLKKQLSHEPHVAIFLPSSVGNVLTNLAVCSLAKTSVNLNLTLSTEQLSYILNDANASKVITSRVFLKKSGLSLPENTPLIYLEDLLKTVTLWDKIQASLQAGFYPASILAKGFDSNQPATLLYTSGSTGVPKGVMLSHHNIISNIESACSVYRVGKEDHFVCPLPLFHAFGYTLGMWLPLISGFGVSYHPNPLEANKVVALVRENKGTLLVATPTFLRNYMKKANPSDFASLRFVLVGGEKVPPELADAFESKYDVPCMQGYGCTELAPLTAISIPNVTRDGFRQTGTKVGSVGQAIPGGVIRIVDRETHKPLPPGKEGLLCFKGANVMMGYWNQPEKTAEVIHQGWYVTGDIARMDHDGFVFITDRASRFSKIGGEMVSHSSIEEALLQGENHEQVPLVVLSQPDDKKGEQLIIAYHQDLISVEEIKRRLEQSALPNLWKPRRFCPVPEIPVLGTGKVDIHTLKKSLDSSA